MTLNSAKWRAAAIGVACLVILAAIMLNGDLFGRAWVREGAERPFLLVLRDDASNSDTSELRQLVESQPGIESVTYVSKSQALETVRAELEAIDMWNGELARSLESTNSLPATLEVRFDKRDSALFRSLIRSVEDWSGFERTIQDAAEPQWWLRYY